MAEPDDEFLPLARKAELLAREDNGLVAVYKPSGVPSHPNREGEVAAVMAPYDRDSESFRLENGRRLELCNRLDSPTSGVLLLAENRECGSAIRRAFRERRVKKTYLAGVCGRPVPDTGSWRDRLVKSREKGQVRVRGGSGKGYLTAETAYRVLDCHSRMGFEASLLELNPRTGRTHQLRVQSQMRNHPILGDKTYGDFTRNKEVRKGRGLRGLLLHAWGVRLVFEPGEGFADFEVFTALPNWVEQGEWKIRSQESN